VRYAVGKKLSPGGMSVNAWREDGQAVSPGISAAERESIAKTHLEQLIFQTPR
jgi:hypothetical protein